MKNGKIGDIECQKEKRKFLSVYTRVVIKNNLSKDYNNGLITWQDIESFEED